VAREAPTIRKTKEKPRKDKARQGKTRSPRAVSGLEMLVSSPRSTELTLSLQDCMTSHGVAFGLFPQADVPVGTAMHTSKHTNERQSQARKIRRRKENINHELVCVVLCCADCRDMTTIRQHKPSQAKTRQDNRRRNKTRQDKTRQDKTRQDKTRQDKTRQDKARQNIGKYQLHSRCWSAKNF
jgi:hypothetical protein